MTATEARPLAEEAFALASDELWLVSPESVKLLALKREIEAENPRAKVFVAARPDEALIVDVDGFDPAVIPGTSSPEPDGLTYAQAGVDIDAGNEVVERSQGAGGRVVSGRHASSCC